jgi:hypothetical protein
MHTRYTHNWNEKRFAQDFHSFMHPILYTRQRVRWWRWRRKKGWENIENTQLSRRNVQQKLKWNGKFFILFLVSNISYVTIIRLCQSLPQLFTTRLTLFAHWPYLPCLSTVGKLFSISFFIFLLPSLSPHTHFKIVD